MRIPSPNPHGRRSPAAPRHGFSLVEVVIALGIASFVLVALVGITAVGASAGRDSRRDTEGGQIFEQIVGQLRTKPFGENQDPDENNPAIFPLPALHEAGEEEFYLDDRNRIAPPASAIRKVRVEVAAPATLPYLTAQGAPQAAPRPDSLALVTIEISPHPARAQSETAVYFAEICRLQQ